MKPDPVAIRQEAMKMLEAADDHMDNYSVQRTATGGFAATHRALGDGKRVRTALSGLAFTDNARRSGRPVYEIDTDDDRSALAEEDFEYGGGGTSVVDVEGMERRSASSRPAEKTNNWSSRYSVDSTLLAMSGSSRKMGSSYLDQMDREHERTSRNLFGKKSAKVFGSGYSFRQKHVFGKQQVTVKPPQNLQTVWMDVDGSSLPQPNNRSKSWQEQLKQKRNQRRRYIGIVFVAFSLSIALASFFGSRSRSHSSSSSKAVGDFGDAPEGAVSFYVTADAPYDLASEQALAQDFLGFSKDASLLFHLGNLQDASVTLCQPSRYADIASLLRQSPLPTFVLPGQEDVNNCPNPTLAFDAWKKSFLFFHHHFDHGLVVMNEEQEYANFAFVKDGVLFLGLHVVGGVLADVTDFEFRNQYNFEWVEGMSGKFADGIRAVVVLGNARPGEPLNAHLFGLLKGFWAGFKKPVAYVHANSGLAGGSQVYKPFEDVDNVVAIQIGTSGSNPPLRMNVGFGDRPFIIG
jgi:hypothetical protein